MEVTKKHPDAGAEDFHQSAISSADKNYNDRAEDKLRETVNIQREKSSAIKIPTELKQS